MNGRVSKRLRKLSKIMAQVKVDQEQNLDPDYQKLTEKRAYKLLKKEYKKN